MEQIAHTVEEPMSRGDERRNEPLSISVQDESDPLLRAKGGVEQSLASPIILAIDGSRESGAALRVTAALAERDQTGVEAVLLEGLAPSGGMRVRGAALRREAMTDSTRLGRVRRQLCAVLETNAWNLHVELGSFGPAVSDLARTTGAALIVLGLRRHRGAHQLLGGGAIARVLQSAQVPVLAVAATARELPRVAIAAIDFSPASLRAARAARDLLARPASLHLLHVRAAPADQSGEVESWNAVYSEGVSLQLERLASELALEDVTIIPGLATGSVTETLVRKARDLGAELIACGANNLNAFERLLVGYAPLELLRRAECSVLIAPYTRSPNVSEDEP